MTEKSSLIGCDESWEVQILVWVYLHTKTGGWSIGAWTLGEDAEV